MRRHYSSEFKQIKSNQVKSSEMEIFVEELVDFLKKKGPESEEPNEPNEPKVYNCKLCKNIKHIDYTPYFYTEEELNVKICIDCICIDNSYKTVQNLNLTRVLVKPDEMKKIEEKIEKKLLQEQRKEKQRAKQLEINEKKRIEKEGVWRCRCNRFYCECTQHEPTNDFAKSVCEDATKLLAEKYGFDFKEAMALVLRS